MIDLKTSSPNAIYSEHCTRGELAYQVDLDTGRAIFFPRVLAPGTGGTRLEWRISKGLGTVYATTAVTAVAHSTPSTPPTPPTPPIDAPVVSRTGIPL